MAERLHAVTRRLPVYHRTPFGRMRSSTQNQTTFISGPARPAPHPLTISFDALISGTLRVPPFDIEATEISGERDHESVAENRSFIRLPPYYL